MKVKIYSSGINLIVGEENHTKFIPWNGIDDVELGGQSVLKTDIESSLKEQGVDLSEPYPYKQHLRHNPPKEDKKELTEEEKQVLEEKRLLQEKRKQVKAELKGSSAPQSNPELAKRVEKLEFVMGIRDNYEE